MENKYFSKTYIKIENYKHINLTAIIQTITIKNRNGKHFCFKN